MIEKIFETRCGNIHYWISDNIKDNLITLMFLPGLTADHRLFEKQIEYFESKYNVFVWDAPAHASSWPFSFEFSLKDKALTPCIPKTGIRLHICWKKGMQKEVVAE